MIEFIIYDDIKERRTLYTMAIKNFLYTSLVKYFISEYEKYSINLLQKINHKSGNKIYIINLDVKGINPLKIARKIRESKDFISPIILISKKNKVELLDQLQNVLFLDIILDDDNLFKNLLCDLENAFKIVNSRATYPLAIYDEIYRIPYDDINYIIKNKNDDSVTIYTKDDSFIEYMTVKGIESLLKRDPRFLKTHRSCIINTENVSSIDCKNNIILFKNGESINKISRANKKNLVTKLSKKDNFLEKEVESH